MLSERWLYVGIGLSLLALLCVVMAVRGTRHCRRMRKARKGDSIETFIREFEGAGFERAVLEMAYADLEKLARFPVRRRDDLEQVLGLIPEELEGVVTARSRMLGKLDPRKSRLVSMFPLKTVHDYVLLVAALTNEPDSSSPEGHAH